MKNRLIDGVLWSFILLVPLLLFSCNQTPDPSQGTQTAAESSYSQDPSKGMDAATTKTASQAPSVVMEAAKEGLSKLPSVISKTPEGKLALGEFFLLHTMHPDALMKATEGVSPLIESTGMWLSMVLLDGQPHLMMTIDKMNGEWKAVAYGGDGFAKELSQIRQAWPAKEGYQLRKVRFYQARADVVQVVDRKGHEVGFVPLTSARIAYGLSKTNFDPATVLSSAKVLASSKQALTTIQSQ